MFESDTFMFNNHSADKKPGDGVMEKIDDQSSYIELSKIKNWRRMLSNEHLCDLQIDEDNWPSIEHYVLAQNYASDVETFVNIKNDATFNLTKLKNKSYDKEVLEKALRIKFSKKPYCDLLKYTKKSTLTHWKRGTKTYLLDENNNKYIHPDETCVLLMKIREELCDKLDSVESSDIHIDHENKGDMETSKTTSQDKHESVILSMKDSIKPTSNTVPSNDEEHVMIRNDSTQQLELKILSKKNIDTFDVFMSKYDNSNNKSVNVLTKYEKTNIIGVRIEQLSMGSDTYISQDLAKELGCVKKIAHAEFSQKKLPYIICRNMPNNTKEYWKLEDLIYID